MGGALPRVGRGITGAPLYVFRGASLRILTMAGSRWSKKMLAPVSSAAIACHVVARQLEVEDVEVLCHALLAHRLRNRDDAALHEPTQDRPARRSCRAFARSRVSTSLLKMSFLPSANGPHDSICTPFSCRNSCVSTCWWNGWVSIWLTAGRSSWWTRKSITRSGWKLLTPIARTRPSAVQLLHRSPRAVDVAVGLVDQVQVEVVESQPLQRPLERCLGALVAGILRSRAWS